MGARPGAPRFDFADIVRQHRAALEASQHLSAAQSRVLTDIAQCRTAVLGGHLETCEKCGHEHPSYNSCRDRHCPRCQALTQEKWIEQQRARLVDAPHFHVVFTLPTELRPLAYFAPTTVYALLFATAAATLCAFGERHLRATIGATMVLHTWTKDLRYHPHVHAIVTAGGLRPDGTWVPAHKRFLFSVKAMSRVFRGKMRDALRRAHRERAFLGFRAFRDPEAFDQLLNRLGAKSWYVYAKPSFSRAKYVVEYLGRYTHRVALSNSRILDLSDDRVVIRTRGDGRAPMTPVECLRRFVRHVLPKRFHKIRHFGIYAGACRSARANTPAPTAAPSPIDFRERLARLTGRDITRCPRCGAPLVSHYLPPSRGPPERRAA